MTPTSGTHNIGPSDGTLTIRTYRDGLGAKIGHDLVLEATTWSGSVNLDPGNPSACRVRASVDTRSFELRSASGGVKAISDKDRADIKKNIAEKILNVKKYPEIVFESTNVSGGGGNLSIAGNLTIAGTTRPVTLATTVDGNKVRATTTVVQSQFGIKPFSAMLGALKVRDAVELEIELVLP